MLLPRFTIRMMLVLVTACAFVFVIAGMAVRGQVWAWGVTLGLLSLVVAALVHAAWFGIVWLFTQVSARQHDSSRGQPSVAQKIVLAICTLGLAASPAEKSAHAQLGLSMSPPFVATNGAIITMPLDQAISRRSGLQLTVDTRWTSGYGYRPLKVSVNAPAPTKADHVITIRFHFGWGGTVSVEQDLELAAGSASTSSTVVVPNYLAGQHFYWWDVWVDEIKDTDLSLDKNDALRRIPNAAGGAGQGLSFLVVGSKQSDRQLSTPPTLEFEVLSLPMSDLPRHWIQYAAFDVVLLTVSELQMLSQSNAEAFESIERWTRAGGQVWITDVGKDFEQLPTLSKLLHLGESVATPVAATAQGSTTSSTEPTTSTNLAPASAQEPAPANTTENPIAISDITADWKPVRLRRRNVQGQVVTFLDVNNGTSRVERDEDAIAQLQQNPNYVMKSQQLETWDENQRLGWPRDSSRWFLDQRMGLGLVRAFREVVVLMQPPAAANPDSTVGPDGSPSFINSLSLALRSTRRWSARHGLMPEAANVQFVDLLVPGVGLAPVSEFRVLITLFVLVIGPVNYWLLKRFRRLHLLVLTVPLAALVTTAALFAYAVIADGFSTSVRAHSFTALDQRSGEAACWTRLSYYAGIAPGDGLTLPADVAIYPIVAGWNSDADLAAPREMIWTENKAKLTRGWLNSRTPTQYLTVRARKTAHYLELLPLRDGLRATNHLGSRISWVLVKGKDGKLFAGNDLSDSSRKVLRPISLIDAIGKLRTIVLENEAQVPAAISGQADDPEYIARTQRRMYRQFGRQFSEERLSRNLVGEMLRNLTGRGSQPALDLPARTYIAFTTKGSEVEFGLESATEEASFHVVLGQW